MAGKMPAMASSRFRAEHDELRALGLRLKEAAEVSVLSRVAVESALDSLLTRLFQHETWEREALGAALAGLTSDHLSLRALAKDAKIVASHPDTYTMGHLTRLCTSLTEALVVHLSREEALTRG